MDLRKALAVERLPDRPVGEIESRRGRLIDALERQRLDGAVLFYNHAVTYYSGFLFVPTERPIALVVAASGDTTLVVPELEEEHALRASEVDEVITYDEFPGSVPPIQTIARAVVQRCADEPSDGLHAAIRLGADHDGYPPLFGYWGPSLSDLLEGTEIRTISRLIDRLMMVKSPYELELLRLSSVWACRAHELLQEYTAPGERETDVATRASSDATRELSATLSNYVSGHMTSGARAGYRGQIGRQGALPHSLGGNIRFEAGDTLVTGATAPMAGYVSELERTMFLGQPSREQQSLFGHMLALQDLCLEAILPGVEASEVDIKMRAYVQEHGLWPLWRHHAGHGIGLRYHEAPFLDRGDGTVLEPGMVLTVEPGLYHPEWGGFRHSDTVVVGEDGLEVLTAAYPRDLAALTLPA